MQLIGQLTIVARDYLTLVVDDVEICGNLGCEGEARYRAWCIKHHEWRDEEY